MTTHRDEMATEPDSHGEILTPEQLSARYHGKVTVRTLESWREQGTGPPHTRLGRRVFYRIEAVREWEESQEVGESPQDRATA